MREGTHCPNGCEVRRFRANLGWTQEELATKTGVGKRTVERIEKGKPATITILGFLAEALGVTVEQILLPNADGDGRQDQPEEGTAAEPEHELAGGSQVAVAIGMQSIDVSFPDDFKTWNRTRQREVMDGIARFLGIMPEDPDVDGVFEGSVVLRLNLPAKQAESLLWAVNRGELESIKAIEAKLVGDPSDVEGEWPTPPDQPRQIGRYRILSRIGMGGMGTVYQGLDPKLNRLVVVKVPRFDVAADSWQHYLREAQAAAGIHPGLCPIYDAGEHGGRPYVVMAYVEGVSLADVVKREPDRYGDHPVEAASLISQVAEALAAAHARGIIHRDLKPDNILIGCDSRPFVIDFGLAGLVKETEDGGPLGTPAYMPPEQLAGDTLGPQADVYSLGVILYQLLTGRLPYSGTGAEVLWKMDHEAPPPAPSTLTPGLDPAMELIVLRAMARRPIERYQTARELAQALAGWLLQSEERSRQPEPQQAITKTRMPYTAAIGPSNPTCFLFLIDQSGSMLEPFAANTDTQKAQASHTPSIASCKALSSNAPSRKGFAITSTLA